MKLKLLSRVPLFVTPWTVAYQALPSMGFSRQEYWSWLPFPSPGDLPNPGIEPMSPALQADILCLSHQEVYMYSMVIMTTNRKLLTSSLIIGKGYKVTKESHICL